MTVTGNTSEMHEKTECYVCGRPGFLRVFEYPPKMLHAGGPPCVLPPRIETQRVRQPYRYRSWRKTAA